MQNKYLICIVGPTAIGKTTLAIHLAEHLQTEIISADSRQFFREMNIGTAKPSAGELQSLPHHLINSISIHDEYNVGKFEIDALKIVEEIFSRNDVAIVCGGSGLYVNALCNGLDSLPEKNPEIRNQLLELHKSEGLGALRNKLHQLDEEFYNIVDKSNTHRMIRALEVCISTGTKYSELRKKEKKIRPFQIIKIGLEDERETVYEKINARVDEMIKQGLEREAKLLLPFRELNALQTVGYKELFDFFENKISWNEAVKLIKQHSRNYAKRQWTWFRRDKEIKWFRPSDHSAIIDCVEKTIQK